MGNRIRTGTYDDLDACVALATAAAAGEGTTDRDFWRRALARDIGHPDRLLVVAEAEGAVAGYARAHLFEPAGDAPHDHAPQGYYLIGLFVAPGHRRRGIGEALTVARLDWTRRRADSAWFFADALNEASIALHRPFGFVETTRRFWFPGATFASGAGILFRALL